ncbi:hypothetical protein AC578_9261 [Pseudocercospora eumusae]|uniref:C3H1-type domain-containing protein n=1 Tax=Pseudocercospora eumusae TaxID=321146 RepID=A0A139HNH3_9PEZI|nr:hypothetical protein AC578_9261 [Pseudocercospora eumusae]
MHPILHATISQLPIPSDQARLSEDCKLRNFSSEESSDQEASKTADDRSCPTHAHVTNTAKLTKHNRTCSFWYHRGSCDKMSGNGGGRACPYLHEAVLFPAWLHKKPCGLALCQWRDVAPHKRKPDERGKPTVSPASPISMTIPSPAVSELPQFAGSSKKRKPSSKSHPKSPIAENSWKKFKLARMDDDEGTRYLGHRDDARVINSSAIDYDDAPALEHEQVRDATVASPPNETANAQVRSDDQLHARTKVQYGEASPSKAINETCFFWYHGRCARAEDEKNGFYCPHKHYLSNPPSMVQAPPGYVHKRPCYLAWCPGDGPEKLSKPSDKEDTDESFIIENDESSEDEEYD